MLLNHNLWFLLFQTGKINMYKTEMKYLEQNKNKAMEVRYKVL